ncbi:MAG: hypothetical protein OEZ06_02585 [Myxococcales bacterium]|nr:hypothetical protein [Myxococcales bacterium]
MKARFFGQHLLSKGLITAPQLLAAVEYQNRNNNKLGEFAVDRGLATAFEVEQIRALQTREDRLFGEAAISLGILSPGQVSELVETQRDAHLELGQALTELGYMDCPEVERAAAEFLTEEAQRQPDVVTLPQDLPDREIAFEVFYLANRLLLRACDLVSKTEPVRVMPSPVPLSDRNAGIEVSGAHQCMLLVGLPHDIAASTAGRFSGELAPDEAAIDGVVLELVHLLADNLRSVLAERGRRLHLSNAQRLRTPLLLQADRAMTIVPFVTHQGQVLVGMSVAASEQTEAATDSTQSV